MSDLENRHEKSEHNLAPCSQKKHIPDIVVGKLDLLLLLFCIDDVSLSCVCASVASLERVD